MRRYCVAIASLLRRYNVVAAVIVALVLVTVAVWYTQRGATRLEGLAVANGRIEAEQTDIAAKYPGRILEGAVEEGDFIEAGHVVARLDTAEIEASLKRAEAEVRRARESVAQAEAVAFWNLVEPKKRWTKGRVA